MIIQIIEICINFKQIGNVIIFIQISPLRSSKLLQRTSSRNETRP